MKKKLIITMVSIISFSLIAVTILFGIIVNYDNVENIKTYLKENNQIIINLINAYNLNDYSKLFKKNYNNLDMRITVINKNGKVLFDSMSDGEKPWIIIMKEKKL